jgi:hypothetical protein
MGDWTNQRKAMGNTGHAPALEAWTEESYGNS